VSRSAAGRFEKGTSGNPSGVRKAKSADGYDGVVAYSGWISQGESAPELQGTRQWRTYARMYERPPVAIWARLRQALFSGITWTAVENEKGGKAARRGKEIVEQGLLKNDQLALPWSSIAAEAMNGAAALGHSIHATAMGRRSDGLVVYTDIAQRPQSTIEQWFRAVMGNEATPFVAVLQRVSNGDAARLELDECLYVVNNNGTGSTDPRGVGMLRLIAQRVHRLDVFEKIEGTEVTSSMGGIPIVRAPLQEMRAALKAQITGKTDDEVAATISAVIEQKTRSVKDFVMNRFKDASKLAWHILDSVTYQGSDPNTISTVPKWGIEIVKGDLQGLPDIRTINKDHDLDIARMLGIEHVFMGGGDTKGTYDALEQKIETMGSTMNAEVGLFAWVVQRQAVRRLVRANGLDPDEAAPTLQPSPIFRTDILKAVQAVVAWRMAGMPPNHPATKSIFQGVDLPWEDETPALMLPRPPKQLPPGTPGSPSADPTKPADEQGTKPAEDPGEQPTEAVKRSREQRRTR
jgi:hypothetical protein